jgi:1,4-dihydroxy-2-naphthoyl-CoA synthase
MRGGRLGSAVLNETARLIVDEGVAVLSINNPPVNALGQPVRAALLDAVERLQADDDLCALVICCEGRTFFPGADIREFDRPRQKPLLPDVVLAIEASVKPVVAAIHANALGGGLEVALGCHARIAAKGDALAHAYAKVTSASRPPVFSSWYVAVRVSRAPDAPRGWPKAIAPPCRFTCSASSGKPRPRSTAKDWLAKASLSSITSKL